MYIFIKIFCFVLLAVNGFAQIRIKAVGDIMLGSLTPKTIIPAESGKIFAKSIGSYLTGADIVFGNLEGAIVSDGMRPVKCSDTSRTLGKCYEFGMPNFLAPSLVQMGFTILNLDNNHSEDYGDAAYLFTLKRLSELNIISLPKKEYKIIKQKGRRIAFIPFGYSGNSFSINDIEKAIEIVKETAARADILIVSFHGGAEGKNAQQVTKTNEKFLGEERGDVYKFAHSVIDAGADLVIGHGPHVLRAIELYNGRLIAYSLGNFLTYGNVNISGVSGISSILDLYFDEISGKFLRGKIIPVFQIPPGVPVYDERKNGIKIIKQLTSIDFPFTDLVLTDSGIILPLTLPSPEYRAFEIKKMTITQSLSKIKMREVPSILKIEITVEE